MTLAFPFRLATNLDPTPEISLDKLDSWLSESGGRLSEQEGLVAFEICFKRQNVGPPPHRVGRRVSPHHQRRGVLRRGSGQGELRLSLRWDHIREAEAHRRRGRTPGNHLADALADLLGQSVWLERHHRVLRTFLLQWCGAVRHIRQPRLMHSVGVGSGVPAKTTSR